MDDDLGEEDLAYLREHIDPCHGWSLEPAPEERPEEQIGPFWRGMNLN